MSEYLILHVKPLRRYSEMSGVYFKFFRIISDWYVSINCNTQLTCSSSVNLFIFPEMAYRRNSHKM
jgi:hypothetical protein